MRIDAHPLAVLIFRRDAKGATIDRDTILVSGGRGPFRLQRHDVREIVSHRGLLWDRVELRKPDNVSVVVRGLRRGVGLTFATCWATVGLRAEIDSAVNSFRRLLGREAYFNRAALLEWKQQHGGIVASLPQDVEYLPLPPDFLRAVGNLIQFLREGDRLVSERNDEFVARKKLEHAEWFARAESSFGLSDEQQEAVLRDEDNCLVVAGAGTGKTTTVAAKAAYLIHNRDAAEHQILLLAFGKKAAVEMGKRGALNNADSLNVRTFHALGLEILAKSDGVKPSLSAMAEDPLKLHSWIEKTVSCLLAEPANRTDFLSLFAYHLYPYRSAFECETGNEYYQEVKSHDLLTLCGERVKSHEELQIANWLYLNGIEYEYERSYEHPTGTVQHRQYKPDFYLPAARAYLEHFGINRQNRPAAWIDQKEYLAGMEWKRSLHRNHKTVLLETYSFERMEGNLLKNLERKLREIGVATEPRDADSVKQKIMGGHSVPIFITLVATFLSLFKGNGWTHEAIVASLPQTQRQDVARDLAFLRAFKHVYVLYERELRTAGEIDFNDMITAATQRVKAGRYRVPFTHFIVDEFQDMSAGRAGLLKALLAQVPNPKLFCVGDDWQSIYRFTGSDIAQMTRFQEEYGFTCLCGLNQTRRFNVELLEASSFFIQKNVAQLKKALSSDTELGSPAIELRAPLNDESPDQLLKSILEEIREDARRQATRSNKDRPDVLILGRYRHTLPRNHAGIDQLYKDLRLNWLT